MKIYIDYTSVVPNRAIQKFNGGGNYTRVLIDNLTKQKFNGLEIEVLYPESYHINSETEPLLYNNTDLSWTPVKKIDANMDFDTNSILFYTILYEYSDFREIIKIHKKRPDVHIISTIHDLRMFDRDYDFTEKYYVNGIKRLIFPIFKLGTEIIEPSLKKNLIKKSIDCMDRIFTDSNYSMQSILKINKDANVNWYYISTIFDKSPKNRSTRGDYILFLSGARRVKNLGHALLGFCEFKKKNPDDILKLQITGIDKNRFKDLCEIPCIDKDIVDKYVITSDYVSNEELGELYRNCRFVLYTSKAEGFGLPVLEAAQYGKTCIASNITSVPEVFGQAVYYVSPKNDTEISNAIAYLCDDATLDKYEKRVIEGMEVIKKRIEWENCNFWADFFEYIIRIS